MTHGHAGDTLKTRAVRYGLGPMTTSTTIDNVDNFVTDTPTNDIREDLRLFVGKNLGEYERLIDIYADETEQNPVGFKFSYALTGFFAPWLWMLHRKMYLPALAGFCIQIAGNYLSLGLLVFLALGITVLLAGKTMYIRNAVKQVRQIRANASSPDQALAEIKRKGGTNILGWIFGILIFGGFFLTSAIGILSAP